MCSLIEQIAREAKATFSKAITNTDFEDSFNQLVKAVGKIQASDVNLNESLQSISSYMRRTSSCYYIQVLSSEKFLISIFILNPGIKLPLHDHPGMHGIVKVIRGSVRISAYTSLEDEAGNEEIPQDVKDRIGKSQRNNAVFIPVNKHDSTIVGERDQPCVLRPKEGNFLEVCALGYMAAFLNVLAPPYDMDVRDYTFYKALETLEKDAKIKTWLVKTPPDDMFYSSTLPYYGPEIKL